MATKTGPLGKKVTLRMDETLWETLQLLSKRDKKLNQSQIESFTQWTTSLKT